LLNEGIDTYKLVHADKIDNNLYKILEDSKKAYQDYLEIWEYKTGDIVKCAYKKLSNKNILLAIQKLS
jgi:hypothetical protein